MHDELREMAEDGIRIVDEYIHTEKKFIKTEHHLVDSLHAISQSIMFLIYHDHLPQVQNLGERLNDEIAELIGIIDSGEMHDLKLMEEEHEYLNHLADDVRHKNWRSARKDIQSITKDEQKVIRLEIRELKDIHYRFGRIHKIIDSETIKTITEDDTKNGQKLEVILLKIKRCIDTYEQIFRDLWDKEVILYRKLSRKAH